MYRFKTYFLFICKVVKYYRRVILYGLWVQSHFQNIRIIISLFYCHSNCESHLIFRLTIAGIHSDVENFIYITIDNYIS